MGVFLIFVVIPLFLSLIGSILAIVSAIILHNDLRKKNRGIHTLLFLSIALLIFIFTTIGWVFLWILIFENMESGYLPNLGFGINTIGGIVLGSLPGIAIFISYFISKTKKF